MVCGDQPGPAESCPGATCGRPSTGLLWIVDSYILVLATCAMGHVDPLVAKLRALGPSRLDDLEHPCFSSGGHLHHFLSPGPKASVVVVGRAGALGGHHARSRSALLRRARGAEQPCTPTALITPLRTSPHWAGLRVGDADAGDGEAQLGVVVGIGVGQLQPRVRDEPQARATRSAAAAARTPRPSPPAPAGCPHTGRRACTGSRPRSGPSRQLHEDHLDRLQDVQRLEAPRSPPACRRSAGMNSNGRAADDGRPRCPGPMKTRRAAGPASPASAAQRRPRS